MKLRAEFGVEIDEEWRGTTDETSDDESSGDGDEEYEDADGEYRISDESDNGDDDFGLSVAGPDNDSDPGHSHEQTTIATLTRVTALLRRIFREYANNRPSKIPA